ncbi:hypothetical protein F4809DRAFT_642912 [Biscogniauxia mediterranea]|nr:hypothetical protein F4809DRAFT_642912 [Biscogniauxia mediterranea]
MPKPGTSEAVRPHRHQSNKYCVCAVCIRQDGLCETLTELEDHLKIVSSPLLKDTRSITIRLCRPPPGEPLDTPITCPAVLLAYFSGVVGRELRSHLKRGKRLDTIIIFTDQSITHGREPGDPGRMVRHRTRGIWTGRRRRLTTTTTTTTSRADSRLWYLAKGPSRHGPAFRHAPLVMGQVTYIQAGTSSAIARAGGRGGLPPTLDMKERAPVPYRPAPTGPAYTFRPARAPPQSLLFPVRVKGKGLPAEVAAGRDWVGSGPVRSTPSPPALLLLLLLPMDACRATRFKFFRRHGTPRFGSCRAPRCGVRGDDLALGRTYEEQPFTEERRLLSV